jgi:hypothetical protein
MRRLSDESSLVNGQAILVDGGLTGGKLWDRGSALLTSQSANGLGSD